jgi:hypothetical protein
MNAEATPIKLGDRFLTQDEFNRMYTHYSELCDKEDTNAWWENQFHMANAQLQDLQRVATEQADDEVAFTNLMNRIYGLIADPAQYWNNEQDVTSELLELIRSCQHKEQQLSQQQQREWISVEKELPGIGEYVLVNVGFDTVLKGRLMNNGWTAFFADGEKLTGLIRDVTHWMPLPTPPTNHK